MEQTQQSSAQQQQSETPNLYEFDHHGTHLSYSTTSITGKPLFTYRHARQEQSFSGDDIHVQQAEPGMLVTVYIKRAIDTGSTSLTLILPRVNLGNELRQPIEALAIEAEHASGQLPQVGGLDKYLKVYHLHGSAARVFF